MFPLDLRNKVLWPFSLFYYTDFCIFYKYYEKYDQGCFSFLEYSLSSVAEDFRIPFVIQGWRKTLFSGIFTVFIGANISSKSANISLNLLKESSTDRSFSIFQSVSVNCCFIILQALESNFRCWNTRGP